MQLADLLSFVLHLHQQPLLLPLNFSPLLFRNAGLLLSDQLVLLPADAGQTVTRSRTLFPLPLPPQPPPSPRCCTHKLMRRISSRSARSSSDSSSSPLEAEEASKRLRLPVSWLLASTQSTRRLQRCGWCCFRRDNTDWTLARTEWLQLAD